MRKLLWDNLTKCMNVRDVNGVEMKSIYNIMDELGMDRRAKKWNIISSIVYLVVLISAFIYLIL